MLANAAYHAAVISGLAIGYARLSKMVLKGTTSRLDLTGYDIGMVMLDFGLAVATGDMLVKQGIIPADVLK